MGGAYKGEVVYVACPYSHEDPIVREIRFLEAVRAVAYIIRTLHITALGAIIQGHELSTRYKMPYDWAFWEGYDTDIIKNCSEVWVICIPGFTNSPGVNAEVKIAEKLGKTVRYMIPVRDGGKNLYVVTNRKPDEQEMYGRIEPSPRAE
jgi:hypothetical protein